MKPAWVEAYGTTIARWMGLNGDHCTLRLDEEALEELRAALAKLAALETENAAWRALARRRAQLHMGESEFFFSVLSGEIGPSRQSIGEAAVAMARQLKLIPEAK